MMKFVTSACVMLIVAASFLYPTRALPQTPAAQAQSAKDEAIPTLRDAHVVALRHLRVIDGTGAPKQEDQTLVIEAGKVLALGRSDQIKVPKNARILDLSGRTVLPGLVMLHEHLFWVYEVVGGVGISHPQHFSFPRLYLAYGVTTMRTAGTDFPYMDLNLKRGIDTGQLPGPEIHLTSPYFSGAGDPFLGAMILQNGEEARRAVRVLGRGRLHLIQGVSMGPKGRPGGAHR